MYIRHLGIRNKKGDIYLRIEEKRVMRNDSTGYSLDLPLKPTL